MKSRLIILVSCVSCTLLFFATATWVGAAFQATTPMNGLYFLSEQVGWGVGNNGLIVQTTDGGDHWSEQPSNTTKDLYEVQFVDANNGWAIGAAGAILHTTNGGTTWQAQTSPAAVDLHGLFLLDNQTGWIGFPDGVLKTTDGGNTWKKIGVGITFQVRRIQFLNANKGFLVSRDNGDIAEILTTSDGGATWTKVTLNPSFHRAVDLQFVNSNFGVVIDLSGTVYITQNGGTNWQTIYWSGSTIMLEAVHFFDANHGWIVGHVDTWPLVLLRTEDGGQHWSKLTGGGNDVHFVSPTKGFIADDDGIRRTIDGGYNWNTVYPGSDTPIITDTPISTFTPTPTGTMTPTPTPTQTQTATPTETTQNAPPCYPLTLIASGAGAKPIANPGRSSACENGRYVAGAVINLQAAPNSGWQVQSWNGTQGDNSQLTTNTLTMPPNAHTVTVIYSQAAATIAPLALGCSSVTPAGAEQPALCLSGLVYRNGQPVAGAVVDIQNAQGEKVSVTTQVDPSTERRPHYRLSLSGPPLNLEIGQTIQITAHYSGVVRSVDYTLQSGSQQVDVVLPTDPATFTRPLATIAHITAINLRQGEILKVRGIGQDSDSSPGIATYRWSFDEQRELGVAADLITPTSNFSPGTHHLYFAVQDTEGEWSDPVALEIYIAPTDQPTWTALLYLAGDYHDGEHLYRRFDSVLRTISTTQDVRIAVQFDGPADGDTRRFLITSNSQLTLTVGEKAMDDPAALTDFVRWGQQTLPAQHYYLAIANHGQAVRGIAWDTVSDLKDNGVQDDSAFLTVAELANALGASDLAPIDVLHLDACSMNLVETGFDLRNVADFLISSQYLGWDYFAYNQYLQKIQANTTAEGLARIVVDQYAQTVQKNGDHPYTIAALRLSRAEPVFNGINALGDKLISLIEGQQLSANTLDTIWQQSGKFETNGDYINNNEDFYLDLDDWLRKLQAQVNDSTVRSLANQLIAELAPYQLFVLSNNARGGALLPRYANGQRVDLSYANGLSIFYPKNHDNQAFDDYINHRLFTFTRYSRWPAFLVAGAGALPGPTLQPEPGPLTLLDGGKYVYLSMIQR